eukprot:CAMPEP_0114422626 /NCGR_PEP_ID=MMETSP0103-20121206/5708_1 /TAXON_ID=37642 ORGANISM="Paraphysomonas imperforata, Strain PA2" /NCGR_SAMPLE_ID=MMETSP0103 /ASSEMBLY_ACC=CAM_ASM_000201 /LENGTH=31 /DNA_ID= /DNA_START= /DNA_END= /DNA_ORIENTATION=
MRALALSQYMTFPFWITIEAFGPVWEERGYG